MTSPLQESHASEHNQPGHRLYNVVLASSKIFSWNTTIAIRKVSGTPEKAYRDLLKQTAMALFDSGHIALQRHPVAG